MGQIKHAAQRSGSVIAFLGSVFLILLGLWMAYTNFIQPHTRWRVASSNTEQTAERIVNYNIDIHKESCKIDFKLFGIRLSTWCKDTIVKEVISQEEKVKVQDVD